MKLKMHAFLAASLLIGCLSTRINGRTLATDEDISPRIGIIGAGVSGTSCAYYLRQLFGSKVSIDIFEADTVGGRTAVVNMNGQDYEAGASIIHNKNRYMVEFASKLNQSSLHHSAGVIGLYGDNGIQFQTSTWTAVTLAKLAWRYGLDLYTIQSFTQKIFEKFSRIYDFQDRGMAFTAVEDMLKAMGDDVLNMTKHTLKDVLLDAGLSEKFVDEFGSAAMRNNYGQTTQAHGFVGAVAMLGAEPGLWSVKNGNKVIPEQLLKASGAQLVKGVVNTVALIKDELGSGSVSYELEYTKLGTKAGEEKTGAREYDILVMAAPLKGTKHNIDFVEFPAELTTFNQDYHKILAMFVHGKVNTTTFKVASQADFPPDLFVVSPNVFFNSIGQPGQASPEQNPETAFEEDEAIWKTFFNKPPTEEEINMLFESRKDKKIVEWWAYPEYSPGMDLPPFMLYDRLYYVNAVESAAAAMEMNVIGARNVALLAYNQWQGNFEKIDELQLPSTTNEGDAEKSEL